MLNRKGQTGFFRQQAGAFCSLEHLSLPVAQISLEGNWRWINQRFSELVGFPSVQLIGKPSQTLLGGAENGFERNHLIAGEISSYRSERKITRKDGSTIWVDVVYSVIRDSVTSQPQCFLLAFEDLTSGDQMQQAPLEMAGRLVQAQEAERTRIARELHDDIGQTLAVLSLQMARAGKPVSDMPGKTHPDISELSEKVRDVAHKISHISHELHSATLEYLGLQRAVQGAAREFREEYHLAVDCVFDRVPTEIHETVGLSFYRVVQEALHNIGKHSGASVVNIHLTGHGQELSLLIRDNGRGFDPEQARLSAGLGLISMRERIELLGGEFTLSSQPGHGTIIRARAAIPDGAKPDAA
jgi:PAS domain S-box-containing protein